MPQNADDNVVPMPDAPQTIRKRSVRIAGHATSVSLEQAFWDSLKELANARGISVNALITEIDQSRGANLSSAIRVFVLRSLKRQQMAAE